MAVRKVKLSVSLSSAHLPALDRVAKEHGTTRSGLLDQLIADGLRREAEERLERETIAYYEEMTPRQRREYEAISRASTQAASEVLRKSEGRARRARRRRA